MRLSTEFRKASGRVIFIFISAYHGATDLPVNQVLPTCLGQLLVLHEHRLLHRENPGQDVDENEAADKDHQAALQAVLQKALQAALQPVDPPPVHHLQQLITQVAS